MYEQFYKLSAKPFRLTPDPRFFFQSRAHGKALAYLQYGLHQGEGIIVITGHVGAGKTTLSEALLSRLAQSSIITAKLVTTQLESDDVLRMVSEALGMKGQDLSKAGLLKSIETFLIARAREGKRVLLLVDEAQNLPRSSLEELRMLVNFQQGKTALLQIFLMGQSEFRDRLESRDMEQFRQRVVATTHLGPLNDVEETTNYIKHRLNLVGWQEDPLLTEDLYQAIHDTSGGIPRRINIACDKLFLYGRLEELHELGTEALQTVMEQHRQDGNATLLETAENADAGYENGGRVGNDEDSNTVALKLASTGSSDTDRRISRLERRIDTLEKGMQKLIMLILFSENNDDLSALLETFKKADEG